MRNLRFILFAVIFFSLARLAAADDSVTGSLVDVVQNVGSMTMMQVRDLALEQAMEIKPLKYKSAQIEMATFTGSYTPTESDRFLVVFSDDGYKITVKLGEEVIFSVNALNRPQHLPNVDGNPEQTRSLHLLPIVLEKGVTYSVEVVYRNKFYHGTTDIDGITVFVVDTGNTFGMCSALCTRGLHPYTAVGNSHEVHIAARVDTYGAQRTYKVFFKPHSDSGGTVTVTAFTVTAHNGNPSELLVSSGVFANYATFTVRAIKTPNYIATELLAITADFVGANPGSVTLMFYDTHWDHNTNITNWKRVANLLRNNPEIEGDERETVVVQEQIAAAGNFIVPGAANNAIRYRWLPADVLPLSLKMEIVKTVNSQEQVVRTEDLAQTLEQGKDYAEKKWNGKDGPNDSNIALSEGEYKIRLAAEWGRAETPPEYREKHATQQTANVEEWLLNIGIDDKPAASETLVSGPNEQSVKDFLEVKVAVDDQAEQTVTFNTQTVSAEGGPTDNRRRCLVTPNHKFYTTPKTPYDIRYKVALEQKTRLEGIPDHGLKLQTVVDGTLNPWDMDGNPNNGRQTKAIYRFGLDSSGSPPQPLMREQQKEFQP